MLMKVVRHPGHGSPKCIYQLDLFQFLEDASPHIREASSVLNSWDVNTARGLWHTNVNISVLNWKHFFLVTGFDRSDAVSCELIIETRQKTA